MDPKLLKAIEAALDAAEAMYNEVKNPSGNLLDQWKLFEAQWPKIKAARRALNKATEA